MKKMDEVAKIVIRVFKKDPFDDRQVSIETTIQGVLSIPDMSKIFISLANCFQSSLKQVGAYRTETKGKVEAIWR